MSTQPYKYVLRLRRSSEFCNAQFMIDTVYDGDVIGHLILATVDDAYQSAAEAGGDVARGEAGDAGKHYAWLDRIWVHDAHRSKGIATTMVEKAARRLGRHRFEWLYTSACPIGADESINSAPWRDKLAAVVAFYESLDFQDEGEAPNGGRTMALMLFAK